MTVASFVAAQRTDHGVPHVISCRALEVSPSWFYKWRERRPTLANNGGHLDAAVKRSFDASAAATGRRGCLPIWSRTGGGCRRRASRRRWPARDWWRGRRGHGVAG